MKVIDSAIGNKYAQQIQDKLRQEEEKKLKNGQASKVKKVLKPVEIKIESINAKGNVTITFN